MKAEEVLKYGNEGFELRTVIDNLMDDQILEAMQEYAKAKCKEQREICSNKCVGIWTESELVDRVLESETPDFE